VADVEHSEQTAGLVEPYLHPADIRSLLAVPVRLDGADKGLLCFEQTGRRLRWTADQMDFARTAAQLFTEDTQGSDAWGGSADPDPADSSNQADHQADPRRQAVARALADSKDGPDKQQASRIDSAAVVVLAFIAEGTVDGSCDASADRQQMIARFVREICCAYDARYHQFHGEQLVLVFQAKAGKAEAVNRAIDAAVCMMEDMPGAVGCEQGGFAAQAGVDLGQVVLVGDFHESADGLRLTGPAVRLATWLARTSSRHMVQLGAAAKEHIGQSYDVHLRGTFLTPEREDRQVFCINTGDINR
jgi:hypothetical protein